MIQDFFTQINLMTDKFILSLHQDLSFMHFLPLVLLIICSGFFSASEIALFRIQPYQLQDKNGKTLYSLLNKMLVNKEMILSTILIGNNIVNVATSIYGSYLFTTTLTNLGLSHKLSFSLAGIILVIVILFWGEIIPKNIAIYNSFRLSILVTPLLYCFYIFLYPVTKITVYFSSLISKLFGRSDKTTISDDQLLAMVNSGEKLGVFDKNEKVVIKNILDFKDTCASEIMTPRNSVFVLSNKEKISKVKNTIIEESYSRIPIYKETIDNIVGIVHQKDLFRQLVQKDKKAIKLEDIAQEPTYIYQKTNIIKIFEQFKKEHIHLGIVVNDFGAFDGIITMEDILEEIVGEIEDEKDKAKDDSSILHLGQNFWLAKNVVDLNSFCRITGADSIEHNDLPYDTLQGLIMFHLRRIPKIGDKIVVGNFSFEVRNMVKNQITLIQIKKIQSN